MSPATDTFVEWFSPAVLSHRGVGKSHIFRCPVDERGVADFFSAICRRRLPAGRPVLLGSCSFAKHAWKWHGFHQCV